MTVPARFASDEIAKTQITEADKDMAFRNWRIFWLLGKKQACCFLMRMLHVLVHSSNIASRMAVSDAKSTETDFADAAKAAINDNISPI